MTAYIGPIGGLVPLKCPASLNLDVTRAQSLVTTTGGRRVAFQAPRSHRSWNVDTSAATPAEVTAVQALEAGMYGPPPWHWVDPWAQVTNVFTPQVSTFSAGVWGGGGPTVSEAPVDLGGGHIIRRSLLIPDSTQFTAINGVTGNAYSRTPVLPRVPVTVSVYGVPSEAGAWVRVDFRDAADVSLGTAHAYATVTPGDLQRLTVTATPPTGAASIRVLCYRLSRVAAPQATWATEASPWALGQGADQVIVDGIGATALRAVRNTPSQQLGANSFQIIEVG